MKPHIRPSNGRWQVMWDIGPDPVTGKRRRRSKTVDTEAQAERLAREVESDLETGWVDDGRLTLSELAEMFLEGRKHRWKPSTEDWYRKKLAYALDSMGHRRVGQISGGALTVFYGRLLDQGLSPTTVNHVHRALRAMFGAAMKWGTVRQDPTARAEAPQKSKTEMSTWRPGDLATFLSETQGSVWHVPFALAAMTGMRRGELLALRWDDISEDYDTAIIRRSVTSIGGHQVEGTPKTRAGERRIGLDETTRQLLRAHRTAQLERRLADPDYTDPALVVAWEDGRPINPDVLTKAFRRISDRLCLPKIRLHDLRHTWATIALEEGISAKVVAEQLGHSSIGVTLDTYTHVSADLNIEAVETVAERLRSTRHTTRHTS